MKFVKPIVLFSVILVMLLIFSALYGSNSDSMLIPGNGIRNLDFLSDLEKEVIVELNLARSNPRNYAQFLVDYKKHYAGKYIYIAGQTQMVTREGVSAVDEAIRYLQSIRPVPVLKISRGLSLAAKAHVEQQGPDGLTGHQGSDGSSPDERMNRFGQWKKAFGENIEYGNWTARRIVMHLIIDDGVKDRGHRKNIFKPYYGVVGVAFGSHQSYSYMCVMDFAGSYIEKHR
jgi:uncharacterized protein YkwD